ncbi:Hsp20/alpha crystallin family protein [candidate division KSB1 bacterium]|nr:Hsp20/alpha crystallin family protein [candidate division KSB1 bacterium]
MSVIRFKPGQPELAPCWHREMAPISRVLDEFFNTTRENSDSMFWGPNVDIVEHTDSYEILAELPGVKLEDVNLTLNNNVLTVSGDRKQDVREGKHDLLRVERTYGRFERSFSLPRTVKADAVTARFEDGVLVIKLPKAEEAKSRTITIQPK